MNKSKKLEDKLIRILTSSFLHLWMFIGFSNSSSRALHRVLSLSNSLWMWYTSSLQRKWVNIQHMLTSNFPGNHFRIPKIQLNWHQIFFCLKLYIFELPEILYIGYPLLQNGVCPSEFLDLKFEHSDILQSLVILNLSLIQCGLLDFDLLVQKSQFIISPNQLCS